MLRRYLCTDHNTLLQEAVVVDRERGSGATTTILSLLREKMNGVDGLGRRKKSFKERLGFGCCGGGPIWGIRPTTMSVLDDDDDDSDDVGDVEIHHQLPEQPRLHQNGAAAPNATHDDTVLDQPCYVVLSDHHVSQSDGDAQSRANNNIEDSNITETPMAASMNLAAALAAERQYRAAHEPDGLLGSDLESRLRTNRPTTTIPGTPLRMSLLRLLEETDGVEVGKMGGALVVDDGGGGGGGDGVCDSMCCVCMGKKKGAAFIPCGHTFCRVCSRELWLNRGSCPLCNRPIIEILDIF